MARKPLIEQGSILAGPDTLSRVISRDREQSGRQPPTPLEPLEVESETAETANTELSNQASKPISKALSNDISKYPSTQVPTQISKELVDENQVDEGQAVEEGSISRANRRSAAKSLGMERREAVVRLSIDVPQSMYDRIKKYVLEHRIDSTRALTLALYQDFLEEEGY